MPSPLRAIAAAPTGTSASRSGPGACAPEIGVKFSLYKLFDDVVSIFEPGPSGGLIDQADPYHQVRHGVSDLLTSSRKLLFLVERFPLSRAAELLEKAAPGSRDPVGGSARSAERGLTAAVSCS
jgi:hypothetical protein